ncbi:uncharacterized protein LOC128922623 [Zeugodacus cucurbitae]|uniref:uncharacterized protein LOC128922623 n=1 Tax=Zeugodacus cucurbitae TaxID=28588 RepID=UPI0023D8E4F3|nr:uncharacterized protein LOC128922623 [Zeugodacus cucurbitae]
MNYSAAEIKEKVHNFTNRYKLEKNAVGMTGGSPSTWIHYKEVEEILSGNKAVNFKELMQESIGVEPEDNIGCAAIYPSTSSQSQFISSDELAGLSTTPESAKRRKLTHERLIENLEKTSDMFEKEMESMRGVQERMVELTEKAVLAEEKRNDILKEMSENTKSFYKDLINLLNKK